MVKDAKKVFVLLICLTFMSAGCCCFKKKKVTSVAPPPQKTVKVEKPKPTPVVVKPKTPSPKEIYVENYKKLPLSHTVVKGECLWWIAEYKQIYNDPFMWPLIYKANRDKIKNPDLIYPGQVFRIPRQFTLEELKMSRKSAGAPRPYLPPKNANIPADLREELNWNF